MTTSLAGSKTWRSGSRSPLPSGSGAAAGWGASVFQRHYEFQLGCPITVAPLAGAFGARRRGQCTRGRHPLPRASGLRWQPTTPKQANPSNQQSAKSVTKMSVKMNTAAKKPSSKKTTSAELSLAPAKYGPDPGGAAGGKGCVMEIVDPRLLGLS